MAQYRDIVDDITNDLVECMTCNRERAIEGFNSLILCIYTGTVGVTKTDRVMIHINLVDEEPRTRVNVVYTTASGSSEDHHYCFELADDIIDPDQLKKAAHMIYVRALQYGYAKYNKPNKE